VRAAVRRLERRVPADALDAAALHQDIELVIQRVLARTPPAYEQFLRHVALGYIAAIVFLEPGLTGLGATVVVVYVLGGMYALVDAMDRAFVPGETLIGPHTLPLRAAVPSEADTMPHARMAGTGAHIDEPPPTHYPDRAGFGREDDAA
jgi:hypothetical protein